MGVRWLLSIVEGMVREVGMPDLLHRRDLAVDPFVLAGVHVKLECHAHHGIAVAAQTGDLSALNTDV